MSDFTLFLGAEVFLAVVFLAAVDLAAGFLAAVFFASACGWSIAIIAVPLGIILGAFYLLSTQISPFLSEAMIGNFSDYGGFIQFLNALRIIKLKDPPVLDLLPGMVLIFPITYFWSC